jgi:hypothetical protein
MVTMPDDRQFFTSQMNYMTLIEFAKTCEVQLSVVKARDVKILELNELAKSICTHSKTDPCELVEMKLLKLDDELSLARSRKKLLAQANIISNAVKEAFLGGEIVSLTTLENEYDGFGLSKATFCNHIARAKKELGKEGYCIEKIKRGQYRIAEPPKQK